MRERAICIYIYIERETDRNRDKDRDSDRQTDRQADTDTTRQRDKRQRDKYRDRDRETERRHLSWWSLLGLPPWWLFSTSILCNTFEHWPSTDAPSSDELRGLHFIAGYQVSTLHKDHQTTRSVESKYCDSKKLHINTAMTKNHSSTVSWERAGVWNRLRRIWENNTLPN